MIFIKLISTFIHNWLEIYYVRIAYISPFKMSLYHKVFDKIIELIINVVTRDNYYLIDWASPLLCCMYTLLMTHSNKCNVRNVWDTIVAVRWSSMNHLGANRFGNFYLIVRSFINNQGLCFSAFVFTIDFAINSLWYLIFVSE